MVTLQTNTVAETIESVKVILPFEKRGEYFVEDIGEVDPKPLYQFWKRVMDIVVASVALLIMALPMLLIAVAIKLSSRGTVLFSQERLGLNGRKFDIVKFRTMYMDAEADGAQWSSGDSDDRVFPFGRFLRLSRLDELPQLWAVIKGELTLVGPRPERECFYKAFETYVHGFSQRLKVKPGLTGLAQVNGGYDLRPEEKIVYDMEYIKKRSLFLDIKIMFKTIKVLFTFSGAK